MADITIEDLIAGVPAGWHKLVRELLVALDDVPGWQRSAVQQIKSKFGGLRFYWTLNSPRFGVVERIRVETMVRKAEERAYETCEECGTEDEVATRARASGWLITQCPACSEKRL